ncbi:hypothetical protein H2274_07200 [Campylobacter sp. W0049]|uniref:hypothetical protein n=1 Tax=Campylobacter molothri TaxID=1032242 RepID=UPI00301C62DC|nr:hypothetical protein [Campylobacter sp. W0049]
MYVSTRIDVDDLEDFDVNDVVELFKYLTTDEQEEFFRIIHKDTKPIERIKAILSNLPNDEILELLKELNGKFKSNEEWQKVLKSINGDEK